ncbi:helix-turn-helix transcriptional regulator [Lactococcus lactis]|uniref:helix-turn-helix transcriptional regulator n=1 Tax=Lactococcus lactis TaxID=1358 RepID=UPI00223BD3E2|nr:helix-turn-helix transcriptional regulator [Lactococcus lactis]MCT0449996.1 XRE family transcriptional regulator [Lactococcus lactis subsp. lactis]
MTTLGNRLKELRLEANLSQSEAAKIMDKTLRTYQRYENDEREPGIRAALNLARYYNVSVNYLVGDSDDRNYES